MCNSYCENYFIPFSNVELSIANKYKYYLEHFSDSDTLSYRVVLCVPVYIFLTPLFYKSENFLISLIFSMKKKYSRPTKIIDFRSKKIFISAEKPIPP